MITTLYTIGYAGLTSEAFIALLQQYGIHRLIDVRRFPNSKTNPDFNQGLLRRHVEDAGIDYVWLGESLGGFREGEYGRYLHSPAGLAGLDQLQELAGSKQSAIMCLERYYTRCHRQFIANTMSELGWRVIHVLGRHQTIDHTIQADLFSPQPGDP